MRNSLTTKVTVSVVWTLAVAGTWIATSHAAAEDYLGPVSVAASKDGKTVYVANSDGKKLQMVDVATNKVTKSIPMPGEASGIAVSPDGSKLYVTCSAPKSTVAIVDAKSGQVTGSIDVGHTAIGVVVSPDGKKLYVCNRFSNDVSVVDLVAGKDIARIPCVHEPVAAAISLDGKTVFVGNHLPNDPCDGYDVASVITVINTADNAVKTIRLPNGSEGLRGIGISPDGKYAYTTQILARYQMPTTQLERGWMNTNAISVIDVEKKALLNTVLLDDVDLGAAVPWDVTCTPDGKSILVTHNGTHELSVIDAAAMIDKLVKMPPASKDDRAGYSSGTAAGVPNDLSFLVGMRRRVKLLGNGPKGVVVIGEKAYVAEFFTDTLSVVDLTAPTRQAVSSIALGPKPKLTDARRGEKLFNDADICFQKWQSCASCHPDARNDALNWDLMNDGLGNPKNVKSMLLSHKTAPAMISGIRATAEVAVRAGITHILFAVRPEEDAKAIDEYLKALKPVPSPYLVDGQLSDAAKRGEKVFNDPQVGCAICHPAPLYTDMRLHDVGSKGTYDRRETFDTPTLVEVWRSGPYMHDGHYVTMKELLTTGNVNGHAKKGTDLKKLLTEQQIDDLVEYVLSL